jgi:hypothetical protein
MGSPAGGGAFFQMASLRRCRRSRPSPWLRLALWKNSAPRYQPGFFKRLSARCTAAPVAGRAQTLFKFLFEDSGGFLHFRFPAAVLDGAEEGDDEVKDLAVAGPLFWGDCHGWSGFIVLVAPQLW